MVSELRGLTPRQDARLGQVVHKVEGAIDRNTTPTNGNTWTPLIARVVEGSTVWAGGRGRCNPMKGTGVAGEEMVRTATEAQKDDPTASQNTSFKHLTRDESIAYEFVNLTGGTLDEDDNLALVRCMVEDSGSSELPGGCWAAITPGTDFGTAIVPRTTIPAVTRTVQVGSDKFEPGVGTAYLFKISTTGEIEPRLDLDGNPIWRTVYNYSTKSFASNDVALELQGGGVLDVQDDNPLEMQADLGPTDYIGPTTDVPFAVMDRSGQLNIPADLQGTGTSTTRIARIGSTKVDAATGTLTPGTRNDVEVWEFTNGVIADTLVTVTAYNTSLYDIPPNEFVLIHQEVGDDRWMIDAPGENLIKGFTGGQGSETLFPYDTLQVYGDRDSSPATVGDIITVNISKAGGVLGLKIDAKGDLFNFQDQQSPGQATIPVALADTIDLVNAIDETMLTQFAEWRLTAQTITLYHGKVFDVTGDTGDVDIFPLEELEIIGAGGTSVAVTKAASKVTALITAGSAAKIAKSNGIIAAFDGVDTAGSGTVTVWEFDGGNGTIAATAEMLTAYNMYDYPVPADEWIIIRPEAGDGRWIVDMDGEHVIRGFSGGTDGSELLFPYEAMIISGDRDESAVVGNIIDVFISNDVLGVKVKINSTGGLFFFEDQVVTQEHIELGGCVVLDTNVSWADFIITPGSSPNPIITLTFADLATIIDDAAGSESFAGAETIEFTNSVVTKAASTVTVDIAGSAADGKVKVRTTDASDFLEAQFTDWIADADGDRYASAQDPLVEFQTDPTTSGLEKIRGFINSSDITGYSASGELHLALDTNVLKWIAPSAAITWTAAGDSGVNQTISGGDTLTLTGSGGAAAAAAGDRGITSVGTATDVMVVSVDATVHQKTVLSGAGVSGTTTVLISAGNRNQLNLISGGSATTVTSGPTGYVELKGDATGGVEAILHERILAEFCVDADQGTVPAITEGDTLTLTGSNLTPAAAQADRGIVTVAEIATDTVEFSVDQTVHQLTALSGTGTSGTTPVLISAGTRNQLNLISGGSATTVQEAGATGWVEISGDATGGVELILHEQASAGSYTFLVDGDQGPVQTIDDTNTLLILGSNLTAAAAQADRGVVSVASATDTITLSVDETVHQKTALSGTGSSGTTPVLISAGTRNQLNLISGGSATTVQEVGSTGWVEVKGDATGGVEFILHEQASTAYTFNVDGDQGPAQIINDTNTLLILGSNLTAAAAQADRGIVSVASATDTITLSVDATVLQSVDLSGTATSGTDPVLVSAGTRNQIQIISNTASTVEEGASKGWIQVVGGAGSIELILHEQTTSGYSFCASGDKGSTQVITDANTLTFTGSNLTAASTAARRGVISTGVATDVIQLSIDETVAQEINVTGTATTGTSLIQASAGTRNRFDFVSNTSSTVQEAGASGWLELNGNGLGGIEFILHEQSLYSFCVDGDQGPVQEVVNSSTMLILGSNLTAAAAQADRGVVSVASAGDIITLSVDETVHQKTVLSGTGTSGTTPVLISDGTRNQLTLISGGSATTVQEAGVTGWVEIVGNATGGVELILHEQAAAQYDFDVTGDKGSTQTITDGNTLDFEGSNLTAAALAADRGIVTTAAATDKMQLSVDESVLQKFLLSGSGQTGSACINVSDGTRNRIEIVSTNVSGASAADPYIEIKGSSSTVELILHPETGGGARAIGEITESSKAPILDGGKRYMDRDGAADTDWAWMDGTSNASPGSGIDRRNYFPRGTSSTSAVTNTAFGRSEASSTTDDDEVTVAVTVTVDDHPNHIHQFCTNECHGDVTVPDTHFDFSSEGTRDTSIQKQVGGAALTLDHTVNPGVVTITNNSATPNANIEMLPAFKKTHYFEKVA